MMMTRGGLIFFLALMQQSPVIAIDTQDTLGLQVNPKGVLVRNGKPYRGVGVNYFNAFYRALLKPEDTSYTEGFKTLAKLKIPFARFSACGFWPRDNALYLKDKEAYFKLMDGVVKTAEESGVGLIPSFFWFYANVPDMMGETVDQWGNPKSKTCQFLRDYTRDIVLRYRNSPAIWGWEFCNEFNLQADLPNAADFRPHVDPKLGTPSTRSKRDDLTHAMIHTACIEFAKEVRKHDKKRAIFTGNAFPRATAWHQRKELSWTHDTEAQYAEMLLGDNPAPMDTLTVHLYADFLTRFNRTLTNEELLRLTMQTSIKAKKPLFIGEFGVPNGTNPDAEKETFDNMLKAIEQTGVPLAALWVYDYGPQDSDWNITATNARSYKLTAISELNKRMNSASK